MKLANVVLIWFLVLVSQNVDARDIFGLKKLSYETADKLNQSIDRARDGAIALEARSNADAKERLNQIDAMVQKTLDRLESDIDHQEEVAQEFIHQFDKMRDDTLNRISDLIDQLYCGADKTITDHLTSALGPFGKLLGFNRIEISPPVLYPGERTFLGSEVAKVFQITEPFSKTYDDINHYLLIERLGRSRDDTPIKSVLQTYLLLAQLSERAGCLVGDKKGYATRYADYWKTIRVWKNLAGEGVSVQ
jgi:hypothetical protein